MYSRCELPPLPWWLATIQSHLSFWGILRASQRSSLTPRSPPNMNEAFLPLGDFCTTRMVTDSWL